MSNETAVQAPQVGDGVTEVCWTDRHPFTIIEVVNHRTLRIQADKATRTDDHGWSDNQSYEYEANPEGEVRTITLRNNGSWYVRGEGQDGNSYAIGHRREYYDYSF